MKLLPVIFSKQNNCQQECEHPSFKQKNIKIMLNSSIANEISKNPNIKDIWGDSKKRNTFLAALSSLMVAAAAEITKIVSGGEDPDTVVRTSDNGDTVEINKENIKSAQSAKFIKHKGKQSDYETSLITAINDVKTCHQISDEEEKQLVDLYNKFCGLNYKGLHYNSEKAQVSNKDIAINLVQELKNCQTKDELSIIVNKYNQFYVNQEDVPELLPDKQEDTIPQNIDTEVVEYIKNYKNILDNYYKTCRDENAAKEKELVEAFIKEVCITQKDNKVKNIFLKKINANYADYLPMLATIFNDLQQNQEEKDKFVLNLGNKLIDPKAIQTWESMKQCYNLTFMEYNAMVLNGYEKDVIKAFAKLKRDAHLKSITINTPDTFTVGLTSSNIQKSFNLINNLFAIEYSDNYQPLTQNDKEDFTIDDVEKEISKRSETYPNLIQHLTSINKEGQPYINKGKIQNLIDIYNYNEQNRRLFTIHSYLRFIERVILNGIEPDDTLFCEDVRHMFVENIQQLRKSLQELYKNPVTINTYSFDEIKAPQFQIEFPLNSKNYLTITINKDNKIHTLY